MNTLTFNPLEDITNARRIDRVYVRGPGSTKQDRPTGVET